ncbi:hypothetical protein GCM10018783_73930 [Streptomyces griseosporeus]|nr:hypothetical protein GCM10018783_73930 [Streptomyces griseosporeus]
MDQDVMSEFLLICTNEGILEIAHEACGKRVRDRKQRIETPINLAEAYRAAQRHIDGGCSTWESY